MSGFADLEIALGRKQGEAYPLQLRFTADQAEYRSATVPIRLDLDELAKLSGTPDRHGATLGAELFKDQDITKKYDEALNKAQGAKTTLRVRLSIDPDARELQALRWETLCDAAGKPLFKGAEFPFSRYLSSANWRLVSLRAESELKALVVVANPAGLTKKKMAFNPDAEDDAEPDLAPLDTAAELQRAEENLNPEGVTTKIAVDTLCGKGSATLTKILDKLRGGFDILYLVCHGAMNGDEPQLFLEDDDGNKAVTSGSLFADKLRELPEQPRLVVLASCESAGIGQNNGSHGTSPDTIAALGPRLAEAGIPAVIGMQGKVLLSTLAKFMPTFFKELRRDGQIDRAVAVARDTAVLGGCPDYWMPVLFMRLCSGKIWYTPGFGESGGEEYDGWPTIKGAIANQEATPILGPGVIESVIGSTRTFATQLADQHGFPLAAYSRDDFPTVAQWFATTQKNAKVLWWEFRDHIKASLKSEFGEKLPPDLDDLSKIVSAVGALRRAENPNDPHKVLASKPFSIYLTVNPDNLLEDALAETDRTDKKGKKKPRSEYARWKGALEAAETVADREPGYRPDPNNPLVYHLFGQFSVENSLVLTEDDYFDYLLRVSSKSGGKELEPSSVRTALTANALLFLGFRLDDWSFRVLLRSIFTREGANARNIKRDGEDPLPCVGAQMEPEEGRLLQAERARSYLKKYLGKSKIDIFWGSIDDFVQEFVKQTA
jgi:hypothetical protein